MNRVLIHKIKLSTSVSSVMTFTIIFILILSVDSLVTHVVAGVVHFTVLNPVGHLLNNTFNFLGCLLLVTTVVRFIKFLRRCLRLRRSGTIHGSQLCGPIGRSMGCVLPRLRLSRLSSVVRTRDSGFFTSSSSYKARSRWDGQGGTSSVGLNSTFLFLPCIDQGLYRDIALFSVVIL